MADLRQELGSEGILWLAACAAYPEIHWALTLEWGARLFGQGSTAETSLPKLTSLVWFRHAFMPDWFRAALYDQVTAQEAERISQELGEIISALNPESGDTLQLKIAMPSGARQQAAPPVAGLRGWLEKFRRKSAIQEMGRAAESGSPMRDYVMLQYLSGKQGKALTPYAPKALLTLLFSKGQPWLGFRPLFLVMAACLVSNGIWWWKNPAPIPLPSPIVDVGFLGDSNEVILKRENGRVERWGQKGEEFVLVESGEQNTFTDRLTKVRMGQQTVSDPEGYLELIYQKEGRLRVVSREDGRELAREVAPTAQIASLHWPAGIDGFLVVANADVPELMKLNGLGGLHQLEIARKAYEKTSGEAKNRVRMEKAKLVDSKRQSDSIAKNITAAERSAEDKVAQSVPCGKFVPSSSGGPFNLDYQNRGTYFEGVRPKPVSGYDIELISVMADYGDKDFLIPDCLRLRFYLREAVPVQITVREQEVRLYYWLDKIIPTAPWKVGLNEFSWPTGRVLKRLDEKLNVSELGVLIRLGRQTPAAAEDVAPAILYHTRLPEKISGYMFTMKANGDARLTCKVFQEGKSTELMTQNFRRIPGGRPFTVRWDAAGAQEGRYALDCNGYSLDTNQPVRQRVRFYHQPFVRTESITSPARGDVTDSEKESKMQQTAAEATKSAPQIIGEERESKVLIPTEEMIGSTKTEKNIVSSVNAEVIEHLKRGVVMIRAQEEGKTKFGTGFVVRRETDVAYIVTAAHVVTGDRRVGVTFYTMQDTAYPATVVNVERGEPGLALLLVKVPPTTLAGLGVLSLDTSTRFAGGEDILMIASHASGGGWEILKGNVVSRKGRTLNIDADVQDGDSGGPIIHNARVVGLVTARARHALAATAVTLQEYLEGVGIVPQENKSLQRPVEKEITGKDSLDSLPAPQSPEQTQQQAMKQQLPEQQSVEKLPLRIGGKDGAPMVLVAAGEFMMGSQEDDKSGQNDERPAHPVFLDAYYIDLYEVTTARYAKFFQETNRPAPEYWSEQVLKQHGHKPVVGVDWNDATAYCERAGKRLPTEAEWEKAARGTDQRLYPWGNQEPTQQRANFGQGRNFKDYAVLTDIGSFEEGKSSYGVYDMAGNVWEWVADWYDGTYYGNRPARNPKGPSSGQYRVLRGGSWSGGPASVLSVYRSRLTPMARSGDLGFRCAQDIPK
ncbi:MAG: SUMF1/EgtB/PvdO family nonheme iron enzyme [Nitrospira sp.]|nr:SUMF1/EgtB/PvdO family nonheme iron enzyme [Nitrospira sp.]